VIRRPPWIVLLVSIAVASGAPAAVRAQASLEERVARLERTVDARALVELLDRVSELQREIQQLRGELELQSHTLSDVRARQRELYLDVDRRLQRVEAGAADRVAGAAGSAPATGGEPAAASAAGVAGGGGGAGADGSANTGAIPQTGAGASPQAVATAPDAPADATAIDPVQEQRAYREAFDLLKAGQYEQAVAAFDEFVDQYPGGKYADNAQYWLGEAYYVTRRFDQAMAEFSELIERYPQSQKLTHGMLKIGYIHHELGRIPQAEQALNALISRYPNTTAARLARERLQRIRSETQGG